MQECFAPAKLFNWEAISIFSQFTRTSTSICWKQIKLLEKKTVTMETN